MTLDQVLAQARAIWGEQPTPLPHMAIVLGVVAGDISRHARSQLEDRYLDETELAKELGNLVLSAVRWMDDLGYRPGHCIGLAAAAQSDYAREERL